MILLVIISNDILLSLSITFTYYLIPDSSFFQYIKSHLFVVENWFSYIALLKLTPTAIRFVEKRFFYHIIAISISTHQYPIC